MYAYWGGRYAVVFMMDGNASSSEDLLDGLLARSLVCLFLQPTRRPRWGAGVKRVDVEKRNDGSQGEGGRQSASSRTNDVGDEWKLEGEPAANAGDKGLDALVKETSGDVGLDADAGEKE